MLTEEQMRMLKKPFIVQEMESEIQVESIAIEVVKNLLYGNKEG